MASTDTPETTRLRQSISMIIDGMESPDMPNESGLLGIMDMSYFTVPRQPVPPASDKENANGSYINPASKSLYGETISPAVCEHRTPLQQASNIPPNIVNKSVRFESPVQVTSEWSMGSDGGTPASVLSEKSSFTAVTPPGSPSQSWMMRAHEELTPAQSRRSAPRIDTSVDFSFTSLCLQKEPQPEVQAAAPILPAEVPAMGCPQPAVQADNKVVSAEPKPKRPPPIFPKTALHKKKVATTAVCCSRPSPLGRGESIVSQSQPATQPKPVKTGSKELMFEAAPAAVATAATHYSERASNGLQKKAPEVYESAPNITSNLDETWVHVDKVQQVLQAAKRSCTGKYSPRTMKLLQGREQSKLLPRAHQHTPEVSFLDKVRKFQEKAEESMLNASRVAFAVPTRSTKPVVISKKISGPAVVPKAKGRSALYRLQLERSFNRSKGEEAEWEDVPEEESAVDLSHVSFEESQIPFEVSRARRSVPQPLSNIPGHTRHVSFSVAETRTEEDDLLDAAVTTPTLPTALGRDQAEDDYSLMDITQQDLEAEHQVRSSRAEALLAQLRGQTGSTPALPRGCSANVLERAITEVQELKASKIALDDAFKKLEETNQHLRRQLRQVRQKTDYLNKSQEQSILVVEYDLQQSRQDQTFQLAGWELEREGLQARIQGLEAEVNAQREEIFALKAATAMDQVTAGDKISVEDAIVVANTDPVNGFCLKCKTTQDEVTRLTATWQTALTKLQCTVKEGKLARDRADKAETKMAELFASYTSYKEEQDARLLASQLTISQRDAAIIELEACIELMRTEKDKLAAQLALGQQSQVSRDQFQSTLYGMRKEELYNMLSEQDQQLQAAQTEVVRLRKRLKDITDRTTKERGMQERIASDLKAKMHNLQAILRDLEERNPNMTRLLNDSVVHFPNETMFQRSFHGSILGSQDSSYSIYDNLRPGTSFLTEHGGQQSSFISRPAVRPLNKAAKPVKKRNLFQRLRDRLRRQKHERALHNYSSMLHTSRLDASGLGAM